MARKKEVEGLVIIHLSSLDSYTDMEREATGSDDTSFELAFNISNVIKKFNGPIFIGDQEWLFIGRESRPRARLMDEIEEVYKKGPREWDPRITWIQFDEQDEEDRGWDKFLMKLDKWLKKNKITRVALAGLFFEQDLSEGCVTHVYKFLKKRVQVKVLLEAVGCVSWIDALWEGPKGQLPGGYTHGNQK